MISYAKVTGAHLSDYYSQTKESVDGIAQTKDDYYSSEGVGVFAGDGVKHWGFDTSGNVDMKEQFEAFVSNRKDTERREKVKDKDGKYIKDEKGKFVTELKKSPAQKGTDFCFSPDKAVSALWLKAMQEGNEGLASQIEETFKQSVLKTMRQAEKDGLFCTKVTRADGREEIVTAKGVVYWVVPIHRTNRDGQIQLHFHVIVANNCYAADDPTKQIRATDLSKFIGARYDTLDPMMNTNLAQGLNDLGFRVSMVPNKEEEGPKEVMQIQGITNELKNDLSRVHKIHDMCLTMFGKPKAQCTRAERNAATLASRKSKVTFTTEQIMENATATLEKHPFKLQDCMAPALEKVFVPSEDMGQRRGSRVEIPVAEAYDLAVAKAINKKEDMQGWFTQRELYAETRKQAAAYGLGMTWEQFQTELHRVGPKEGLTKIPGYEDQPTLEQPLTTGRVLAAEKAILEYSRRGQEQDGHKIDRTAMATFAADYSSNQVAAGGFPLKADQLAALDHIAKHSDRLLVGIQGRAGTGKSTGIAAPLVDYLGKEKVTGLCNDAVAAQNLQAAAGCESQTIASWLIACEKGDPATIEKLKGGYIIIDEAGIVGSVNMAAVLQVAEKHGAKVVLMGDTDQLAAVSAGNPFLMLQRRAHEGLGLQTIESAEIVRQKDKKDQEAIKNIIDAKTAEAIAHFAEKGCIVEATRKERIKELTKGKVEGILADKKEGIGIDRPKHNPLTIVSTNKEREEINKKTHAALKKAGYFTGKDVEVTAKDKDGKPNILKIAPGEHIMFLENDKKLGVSNGNAAIIKSVSEHEIIATLADGKDVTFNPAQYGRFDYAYALTSYKSQGQTFDKVQGSFDTYSSTACLQELYVIFSRHKEFVKIYVDSLKRCEVVGGSYKDKTTATEVYEKGQARIKGHPVADEAVNIWREKSAADAQVKEVQAQLVDRCGSWQRVPKEVRNLVEKDYEENRKKFSDKIDRLIEKNLDSKDSITADVVKKCQAWRDDTRSAKRETQVMREKGKAQEHFLAKSAAKKHLKIDNALVEGLVQYHPQTKELRAEMQAQADAIATEERYIRVADQPAFLAAERHADKTMAALAEVEKEHETKVKEITDARRDAVNERREQGGTWEPEDNKAFIDKFKRENDRYAQAISAAVEDPAAREAVTSALHKWEMQQSEIKKGISSQNYQEYGKSEKTADDRDKFDRQNDAIKSIYSINKGELDAGFASARQLAFEAELFRQCERRDRPVPPRSEWGQYAPDAKTDAEGKPVKPVTVVAALQVYRAAKAERGEGVAPEQPSPTDPKAKKHSPTLADQAEAALVKIERYTPPQERQAKSERALAAVVKQHGGKEDDQARALDAFHRYQAGVDKLTREPQPKTKADRVAQVHRFDAVATRFTGELRGIGNEIHQRQAREQAEAAKPAQPKPLDVDALFARADAHRAKSAQQQAAEIKAQARVDEVTMLRPGQSVKGIMAGETGRHAVIETEPGKYTLAPTSNHQPTPAPGQIVAANRDKYGTTLAPTGQVARDPREAATRWANAGPAIQTQAAPVIEQAQKQQEKQRQLKMSMGRGMS